ncbi:MAG: ribosomal RNA small subunit methyltransferase A, partial [SAR202 cluster bacterium]|nr:ribosomal RNA small subunit methyltransferase A [SAR202 cluster bacterium]
LEVGPGMGVLTDALVELAGTVVAVEIDRDLAAALAQRLSGNPRVRVVHADARTVPLNEVLSPDCPYKVVANLPYYAATPIIRRFLEGAIRPTIMVVTVQREVAQRMVAQPGDMSLLSVGIQVYGKPKIIASVPPGAFRPAPDVTSAVVRVEPRQTPLVGPEQAESFFALVRAGFSAPRKQLQGAMSHAMGRAASEIRDLLESAGVDPTRRAETLSIEEWLRIFRTEAGRLAKETAECA